MPSYHCALRELAGGMLTTLFALIVKIKRHMPLEEGVQALFVAEAREPECMAPKHEWHLVLHLLPCAWIYVPRRQRGLAPEWLASAVTTAELGWFARDFVRRRVFADDPRPDRYALVPKGRRYAR